MSAITRAVIYTRQSKDRNGDGLAVARQLADCEKLAASRGWQVTRRLSDNDTSASNGKPRPGFREVMRLADERQIEVIVVWAVDRLVRRLADLEDVIERCERADVKLATVSGDLDLSTDQGRLVGRILASVARGEVERKSARQKLANGQAAAAGKRRTGCPRPFGYLPDHVTPDPAEGPAVASAVALINAGGSISAVAREWTRAGLVPPQSKTEIWTRSAVRTVLLNPAVAALSAYRGEVIADGTWAPLVSREEWEACRARLEDPARKPPRGVRTLLGGLALCTCGAPALGSVNHLGTHVYRCPPAGRKPGTGPHVARVAADVDHFVTELVIARLSAPDAVDLLPQRQHADVAALSAEANAIRVRRDELGALFADGDITRAVLLAGTERAEARLAEIGRRLAEAASDSAVAPLIGTADVRKAWDALDLSRQRAVIQALVTVTLLSPGRGCRDFDPGSVRIDWPTPSSGSR